MLGSQRVTPGLPSVVSVAGLAARQRNCRPCPRNRVVPSTFSFLGLAGTHHAERSRAWWNETEGYDKQMQGWGGENIDQSLRIWLCGGEIVPPRTLEKTSRPL